MKLVICVLAIAAMAVAEETSLELLNKGNDEFTAKMFNEVVTEKHGESVVMSAFSVLQPLAQLSLGAVGASHDELLRAISLPNDNVTIEAFSQVKTSLRSVRGVDLKTASNIYVAAGHELQEQYTSVMRNVFDSDIKSVDFTASEATAKEINDWVEDHTNHKIKDLVDPDSLSSDTRAVLVNAIYFKGSWKEKFNPQATTDREFHVSKDKTVNIPMMFKKADFKYAESEELNAKLLEMPYEGDQASMLFVLPNEIDGLPAVVEKLKDPTALNKAVESLRSVEVNVYLPKFKIETKIDLKDVLTHIGVEKIFDPANAQLERMFKGESNLYVSEAIQKAFIEVNEEGAEATAANEMMIVPPMAPMQYDMDINHPFAYFLRTDGKVLFSGVYFNV